MILVSACLLGCACRYDGQSKPHPLAMELARQGDTRALLAALTRHRSGLLENVRTGQRQIDCLDYLIYQIQNGKTGGIFHEHAL